MGELMIYGAYGYTGALTARMAVSKGMRPLLAGRDASKLSPLADELQLDSRAVGLDDPAALAAALEDVDVVLHCAGPFSRTAQPMATACLKTGTHYLDITGEAEVFERLAARDAEAREAGVMLMPGTGFDVVPTDCLAAHLKDRLPTATHLTLAFAGLGGSFSRGTATTMVENLHRGDFVRRGGRLTQVRSGSRRRDIDYGDGPMSSVGIPWGDIATAWRTTGIPNIEVYTALPRAMVAATRVAGYFGWLLGSKPAQRFLLSRVKAGPAGPSDEARARAHTLVWGEATDAAGQRVESRLRTPEGYTLTAMTSLEIARHALAGEARPGYQTPAGLFGADFICQFPNVTRTDV